MPLREDEGLELVPLAILQVVGRTGGIAHHQGGLPGGEESVARAPGGSHGEDVGLERPPVVKVVLTKDCHRPGHKAQAGRAGAGVHQDYLLVVHLTGQILQRCGSGNRRAAVVNHGEVAPVVGGQKPVLREAEMLRHQLGSILRLVGLQHAGAAGQIDLVVVHSDDHIGLGSRRLKDGAGENLGPVPHHNHGAF